MDIVVIKKRKLRTEFWQQQEMHMPCITCERSAAICDDYCVDCEIKFFRANPDEQPSLFEQVERDPVRFAAWIPVVTALQQEVSNHAR